MFIFLVPFFLVIKTSTIPLTMLVPTHFTTHYCSLCFDNRNFRKLGFYSLQLGLRRITVWCLEFGLQSHHFRQNSWFFITFSFSFLLWKSCCKGTNFHRINSSFFVADVVLQTFTTRLPFTSFNKNIDRTRDGAALFLLEFWIKW